jgi:hypothetical protein
VGRIAPVAEVAHGVVGHAGDLLPLRVEQRQPQPGGLRGAREQPGGQVPAPRLGGADGGGARTDRVGELTLGEIRRPPDAPQRAGEVERAHPATVPSPPGL